MKTRRAGRPALDNRKSRTTVTLSPEAIAIGKGIGSNFSEVVECALLTMGRINPIVINTDGGLASIAQYEQMCQKESLKISDRLKPRDFICLREGVFQVDKDLKIINI